MTQTNSGRVFTVAGQLAATSLGFVLPHEHLLFDFRRMQIPPADHEKAQLVDRPVALEILGALMHDPLINSDNLVQKDEDIAASELALFKEAGGGTVVDLTSETDGRDPVALRRLSDRAGVHIVAGSFPGRMGSSAGPRSADQLAEAIVAESRGGISGTDVYPGIIGEIEVSRELLGSERDALRGAAMAQSETGLSLFVRLPISEEWIASEVVNVLKDAGASLPRVAIGGLKHTIEDVDAHRTLADLGIVLCYDRFGAEFMHHSLGNHWEIWDRDVVPHVARLIQDGYADRILVSHDASCKIQFSQFGGYGLRLIPLSTLGYLRSSGVEDADIRRIVFENPARLLTVG